MINTLKQLVFGNRTSKEMVSDVTKGDDAVNTKECYKCKKVKPVTEFHRNTTTRDGLQSYCKDCMSSYYELYSKLSEQDEVKGQKKCSVCNEVKALSEFYRDITKHDGHNSKCAECSKKYDSKRRKKVSNAKLREKKKKDRPSSFKQLYIDYAKDHNHIASDKEIAYWIGLSDCAAAHPRNELKGMGYTFAKNEHGWNIVHPVPEKRDALAELMSNETGKTYDLCLELVKQLRGEGNSA